MSIKVDKILIIGDFNNELKRDDERDIKYHSLAAKYNLSEPV